MKLRDEVFFKTLGARIARVRKARLLSQAQLGADLGIAQQTLAHYERARLRLPASLLPALSQALRIPVEELLGVSRPAGASAKRANLRRLQLQIEAVTRLPRAKQKFVLELLDTFLAHADRWKALNDSDLR